jgi:hypothetical protein
LHSNVIFVKPVEQVKQARDNVSTERGIQIELSDEQLPQAAFWMRDSFKMT